jgi:hypothetical protein
VLTSLILFVGRRIWFDHATPQQISITGTLLLSEVRGGDDLSSEVMAAYVRLMQHQDKEAYGRTGCVAVKWRQYMEPFFAVRYYHLFYLYNFDSEVQNPVRSVGSYEFSLFVGRNSEPARV